MVAVLVAAVCPLAEPLPAVGSMVIVLGLYLGRDLEAVHRLERQHETEYSPGETGLGPMAGPAYLKPWAILIFSLTAEIHDLRRTVLAQPGRADLLGSAPGRALVKKPKPTLSRIEWRTFRAAVGGNGSRRTFTRPVDGRLHLRRRSRLLFLWHFCSTAFRQD